MSFVFRLLATINDVDPKAWNACAGTHPFCQHAFLKALEDSGAVGKSRGVLPRYVLLYNEVQNLVACAPGVLKWNTLREYGPEAGWLRTGLKTGCFSWPKFQLGVPFFPTMGPRILVRPGLQRAAVEQAFLNGLLQVALKSGSRQVFNVMYVDTNTARCYKQAGAMLSCEYQSMWDNRGYADLKDYLATLHERKRSRFLKDRRCAESQGMFYRVLRGSEISEALISDYYDGHQRVCARYGNYPWLPEAFYQNMTSSLADAVCLFGYFNEIGGLVAGMLAIHAKDEDVLYLLQWSDLEQRKGLALDLICLRPIDYAIAHGISKIDSGLAAKHKALRGWQTQPVFHGHWFSDNALKNMASAVLQREIIFNERTALK